VRGGPTQWREEMQDFLYILWIIAKGFIVASVILLCGRGLAVESKWLFGDGKEDWSVEVIKVLSDLFAILAFISLAVRDLRKYLKFGS